MKVLLMKLKELILTGVIFATVKSWFNNYYIKKYKNEIYGKILKVLE